MPIGQSSRVAGYTSGGYLGSSPAPSRVKQAIDKFPFANDASAVFVGNLSVKRYGGSGQQSVISGYTSGGAAPAGQNTIDKFPFATDASATDVGDLTVANTFGAGQSSLDSGYSSGGDSAFNVIQKFPFATDASATDVGDLTVTARLACGQQV